MPSVPQDNKRLREAASAAEQRAEEAQCDAVRAAAAAADARAELATRPQVPLDFHSACSARVVVCAPAPLGM